MEYTETDVAIIGAGGAGLRAAIAIAMEFPELRVALVSKVYPMRSHTVAAEGGAAGVVGKDDSLEKHFEDTVAGGDWLCDQDVVNFFVSHTTQELIQLEHWGCPWSRTPEGEVCVRKFGGMKVPRTWFTADKSGFHILHTLYQTSTRFKQIQRFDEHFVVDLIEHDGEIRGLVAFDLQNGVFRCIQTKAVIMATGGAAQAYSFTTNATIVTGDGMALAYRHGVPLRDMEFVQYHPTGLLGCGLLITEGARGEGGILINKDGYRYLQDYGLGPETPLGEPQNKTMELGPRDRLSQAFWHEHKMGRTIDTPLGPAVHLDLRHLGTQKLHERLPLICELAESYAGVDPAKDPIPVRPVMHYTMGGIETDIHTKACIPGLFAAGECASVGIHGANRLGSNSLAEILVFGHVAGTQAGSYVQNVRAVEQKIISDYAENVIDKTMALFTGKSESEDSVAKIRQEMGNAMEEGVGIYRDAAGIQKTTEVLRDLKSRYRSLKLSDADGRVFNFELVHLIELGFTLDVADAMAHSALHRNESRGSHQRLEEDYQHRDDVHFLKHTLAHFRENQDPEISYSDVKITHYPPAERVYGGAK